LTEKLGMARIPRHLIVIPHHPHHVILRGNNRRRLFSYPCEQRFFLMRLLEGSQKHGTSVHSTVLMTNHVHLVVTPTDHQQLARFVRSFAQPYAQFRNRRRGSSGKLFEERYKCIPIRSDQQMAITTVYVELNPVRAGICAEPGEYRWSTFPQHAGREGREPLFAKLWSPSAWYVSLGSESAERAAVFGEWLDHYRTLDDWSKVYGDPERQADRKRFERPNRKRAI